MAATLGLLQLLGAAFSFFGARYAAMGDPHNRQNGQLLRSVLCVPVDNAVTG